jgi:hypothetical protein
MFDSVGVYLVAGMVSASKEIVRSRRSYVACQKKQEEIVSVLMC